MTNDNGFRSKRGTNLRGPSGTHSNELSRLKELLPGDVTAPLVPELDMDLQELVNRGLIFKDDYEPELGAVDIGSKLGINHDGSWTPGKPKGLIRGKYLLCPREYLPYLAATFAGHSPRIQGLIWGQMFFAYQGFRHVLIEVQNVEKKRTWFGVFNSRDASIGEKKLLTLICSDIGNGMSYDFVSNGDGGFKLDYCGFYPTITKALDARDENINKRLDQGWTSYNCGELSSGSVKRWVSVEIGFALANRLGEVCARKHLKIKDLVSKLVTLYLKKSGPPEDPRSSPAGEP